MTSSTASIDEAEQAEYEYLQTPRAIRERCEQVFDVARKGELEHWLLDEWRAPEKVHYWDREPRKARYKERQWGLYHSDKGSMPVLERHGYYLEWNSVLMH